MRYNSINNNLFINNRKNFVQWLKPKSIAIFTSNDVLPTNADGTMPFRQNNDLFYLSGIDQEDTFLIIFPEASNEQHKEILFVKETNEHIAVWEGAKLSKEKAKDISGIKNVMWTSKFEGTLNSLAFEADHIYLNFNEHTRAEKNITTKEERLISLCKEKYPLHHFERSSPIMHALRAIKSDWEIELIKEAIKITDKTFRRVLSFVKPGVKEYEIEAEIFHEFIKNRSRGPAYSSIIASGADSCVLHYIQNNKECKESDILLLDFGAEYANYAADLTRSIPVSGKFSERQKEVYNAVLRVMRKAKNLLVPGNTFEAYNKEVAKYVEEELVNLRLLNKIDIEKQDAANPLYKKYFMHGISHFLGLDVHDVGSRNTPFAPGMILTCEPGIYIREESLGIRLENDILITSNGPIDLMEQIPIEAEEIEELLRK